MFAGLTPRRPRELAPSVAHGLSDLGCLRDAPNFAARHPAVPANTNTRLHAIARSRARGWMVYELCRTVLRESGTRGFDVRCARLQRVQAIELLVDPLDGSGKNLLALQRLIGGARKALAARLGFSAQLPLFLPRQRSLLVTLLP